MQLRQQLLVIASVLVSGGLLLVILRDVPIADVIESMRGADAGYLLAALLVTSPLALFTRGIRWWLLLSQRLPLSQAAHMVNIMFLGNQLPHAAGRSRAGGVGGAGGPATGNFRHQHFGRAAD